MTDICQDEFGRLGSSRRTSAAPTRRSVTGAAAGWSQPIPALECDGSGVAASPASPGRTDDGGVVVASTRRIDAVEESDASEVGA